MNFVLWQSKPTGRRAYAPIGFDVFRAEADGQRNKVAASMIAASRQVTLDEPYVEATAGQYVVVPFMHTAETEADFVLDVHFASPTADNAGATGSVDLQRAV